MGKPQKKQPEVKIHEPPKTASATPKKAYVPRKRDPKKTPQYVVQNKRGETILHGETFTKLRLARRAAQRHKDLGGQPAQITNKRTGEAHLFVPFPPKPKSPEPADPATAVKPAPPEREYASI